jgi:hypothetical protein
MSSSKLHTKLLHIVASILDKNNLQKEFSQIDENINQY